MGVPQINRITMQAQTHFNRMPKGTTAKKAMKSGEMPNYSFMQMPQWATQATSLVLRAKARDAQSHNYDLYISCSHLGSLLFNPKVQSAFPNDGDVT